MKHLVLAFVRQSVLNCEIFKWKTKQKQKKKKKTDLGFRLKILTNQ